ncbi:uncharacterized protein LOC124889611 [Capsicum annuum]|uniref:uncharacterized protein LOC124889611 n=1 Tax=Capsicum annuum TaxID=4072 RepID=UPI001FB0B021|nr:uncharacterized protein LOC124889611 [Capsicum annuum]
MPKVKAKEVLPQSQEENDGKESDESDEEVVEINNPQKEGGKLRKFMAKLSNLSINIPLLEAIQENLRYAKLMKKMMSKKNLVEGDTIEVTYGCSAIMDNKVMENKDDLRAFTIPCTIGTHEFAKDICDVDQSIKMPVEILFDVLVKVDKFILSADFVVLDCEMEKGVPIILGRPLFATGKATVDLVMGEMKFRVQEYKVSCKICKTKKQTAEL